MQEFFLKDLTFLVFEKLYGSLDGKIKERKRGKSKALEMVLNNTLKVVMFYNRCR